MLELEVEAPGWGLPPCGALHKYIRGVSLITPHDSVAAGVERKRSFTLMHSLRSYPGK